MTRFYLDTSALFKRYHEEAGSEFVNELFDYQIQRKERMCASILAGAEFCSAIRRHQRNGGISSTTVDAIISAFLEESEYALITFPVEKHIISQSIHLLSHYSLKAYDAVQLATYLEAKDYSVNTDDYYFVCDDERLCEAAEKEHIKVLRPRFSKIPR